MTIVVNTDELTLKLTSYGMRRITTALSDNSVTLNLAKIKVGDAKGEYYVPDESTDRLRNPIPGGTFNIIKKELLEDNLTVSLQAVIPETFGGCDIREVGLYETVDGEDYLFAISTQQPMVKPKSEYNYYIAIDYYLFLKSVNLAELYDRIILDPDNVLITEEDIQELMGSMLFTQGNLSVQIGKNTHVIGLDRPTQLYEQIVGVRDTLGYSAITGNYATFCGFVGSSNLIGYWVFNYPKRNTSSYSITDIGLNGYNMSTSRNINLCTQSYNGIVPFLSFEAPSYYYLNTDVPFTFYNRTYDEDYSFTMMFLVEPISTASTRTLLAKSNYATSAHCFEVNELVSGAVEVKLFTDSNNYITFTSPAGVIPNEAHTLIISYDRDNISLSGYLNGNLLTFAKVVTGTYTHMNEAETTLYGYKFTPYELVYADSSSSPTELYNADGSPYENIYWAILGGAVYYESTEASYNSTYNVATDPLYAWTYDDGVHNYYVYTKTTEISSTTKLYNEDYSEYTGDDFSINLVGAAYIIQYQSYATTRDSESDIASKTIYAYIAYLPEEHIWANSSTAPTILFTGSGEVYTGTTWVISGTNVVYVNEGNATYDSSLNLFISALETSSFIVNAAGNLTQLVNSKVGMIAAAKEKLSDIEMKICALELQAALGQSPCILVN